VAGVEGVEGAVLRVGVAGQRLRVPGSWG